MKENTDNFYELVYALFYNFAQKKPENVSLLFSRYTQYPLFQLIPELQLIIPLPRQQGTQYVFEGMLFENSECGRKNLWCLFLSTLYHLAAHACLSDYSIYQKWKKNKTNEHYWRVIDFIEDIRVNEHLSHTNSEIWENMVNVSSKFLLAENTVDKKYKKNEKIKYSIIKSFYSEANQKQTELIRHEITESFQEDITHRETMLKFADLLYKNRNLLPKTIFPFVEHHYDEHILKVEKFGVDFEPRGLFEEKIAKLDELWIISEQSRYKLLKRYAKPLRNLNFDKIAIPPGDIHAFAKAKLRSLPMLGRIREQVRVITNMMDDPITDNIGYLDMQMAIQAIASEGQSTEIFERDELRRGQEAWIILIDKSASMKLRFDKIRDFTICLSESATQLTGKSDSWALYSFDNNFEILKDFKERYSNEVQARIGSLENSGLSLLPDAIELAYRILSDDPREKKCIFIITDGQSSGYDKIQDVFSKIVKKTESSNVTLIAIGVSNGIKGKFKNSAKGKDVRQLISKFITAYRIAASDV